VCVLVPRIHMEQGYGTPAVEVRSWHHNHRRLACSCGHVDLVVAVAVKRRCNMGLASQGNLWTRALGGLLLRCYYRCRGYKMVRHSEHFAVRRMDHIECTQKVVVREMWLCGKTFHLLCDRSPGRRRLEGIVLEVRGVGLRKEMLSKERCMNMGSVHKQRLVKAASVGR